MEGGAGLGVPLLATHLPAHLPDVPELTGYRPGVGANSEPLGREPGSSMAVEARRIMRLAVPISATEVLSYLGHMITVAQVGRLSGLELSALSLAQTFFNITGLSLVIGISSALETFCGQAVGAGLYKQVGVSLQRGLLISGLTAIPPAILWIFAKEVLLDMGQQADIVQLAVQYIQIATPVLLISSVTSCIQTYLRMQSVVTPLAVVTVVITALTPVYNHFFIYGLDLRLNGAAVSYVSQSITSLALLLALCAWHHSRARENERTWGGWSKEALSSWGRYMKVALPSLAMICLDWWMFETLTLLAGWMPDATTAVGATGICFGIHVMVFFVIAGVGAGGGIRVANELGAGRPDVARKATITGAILGFLTALVCTVPIYLCRNKVARLFTPDQAIVDTVVRCLPFLLLSLIGDSVNTVMSGVLRGAGRQTLGFLINLVTFWVLGLPFAAFLGLHLGLGAPGLWQAVAAVSLLQAFVIVVCVARIDWNEEARRARERVRQHEEYPDGGEGGSGEDEGEKSSGLKTALLV